MLLSDQVAKDKTYKSVEVQVELMSDSKLKDNKTLRRFGAKRDGSKQDEPDYCIFNGNQSKAVLEDTVVIKS